MVTNVMDLLNVSNGWKIIVRNYETKDFLFRKKGYK